METNTTTQKSPLFTAGISGIKNALRNHKGQNIRATWERPVKLRKTAGALNILKRVSLIVRGGVDYDNMKAVAAGREDGTLPAENAGLPWGEWVEFPLHIAHKGQDYVRLYPASGINFPMTVTYTLDGKEIDKEQVKELALASEFSEKDAPLCYTVKAENIVSLG